MGKSPSGIALSNHSILVRSKAKKNVSPYSPMMRLDPGSINGSILNTPELNLLQTPQSPFPPKYLQRGFQNSVLLEDKVLQPSNSNITLKLEDVQRPQSIELEKKHNLNRKALKQSTILHDDNLHSLGAKKVLLNDHSKLLKDYKDRQVPNKSSFNYIQLEDQKEEQTFKKPAPLKKGPVKGFKDMDGNLYKSYIEYRKESLNKV
jgi:hypothetical protein